MSCINLPDWAEPLYSVDFRYFCLNGGRGSSKSRTVASVLVTRGAKEPKRILCVREIQKSIRDSVKRLLDDEIERCGLRDFYTSTDTEIRGKNGTLFLFAGLRSNIDSIKSMEGIDIVWLEEGQNASQVSLDILIPTIRKPGSQFYFCWNPKYADDPIERMFSGEKKPPGTFYLKVNYDQNPWFPDVLREQMEYDKSRDIGKYLHVWEGEYIKNDDATVFKNWKIEEFETAKDAVFRFGADWGYAKDPTVLIRCYIEGRKLFIDYEAYQVGCEIVDTPELFLSIPESETWPIVADSSRPETISHLRKHGFPKIMKSVKGAGSVEDGIEFLKSYDIIVHPRCKNTIDELIHYRYKTDPLTEKVLPVFEDKDNHVIDALRYSCEAVRRVAKNKKKPEFVPIPTANRW